MQTIHFTLAQLKAAQILAAVQDIRYYLNGVFIEATPFETRLVATDGHKCGVIRHAAENDVSDDVSLIIPSDVINKLKAAKRDMQSAVYIEIENGKYVLHAPALGYPTEFAPIDGRYPDYRRIFPKTTSGEPGQYSVHLLMDFAKAARVLLNKSSDVTPRINYNGENARVSIDDYDNFAGVVMGWRAAENSKPADTSWI